MLKKFCKVFVVPCYAVSSLSGTNLSITAEVTYSVRTKRSWWNIFTFQSAVLQGTQYVESNFFFLPCTTTQTIDFTHSLNVRRCVLIIVMRNRWTLCRHIEPNAGRGSLRGEVYTWLQITRKKGSSSRMAGYVMDALTKQVEKSTVKGLTVLFDRGRVSSFVEPLNELSQVFKKLYFNQYIFILTMD